VIYVGPMILWRPVFLALAGAVATLTPLALASPPDPTWISGLYDDADYDDAVLAVMTADASCGESAPNHPRAGRVVLGVVRTMNGGLVRALPPAARHTRAPPAS
jgi:hypothetical protein